GCGVRRGAGGGGGVGGGCAACSRGPAPARGRGRSLVEHGCAVFPRRASTRSSVRSATARYVVYLPPITVKRPFSSMSRDSREAARSVARERTSGRNPA